MRRLAMVLVLACLAACDAGASAPAPEVPAEVSFEGKTLTQWIAALDSPTDRKSGLRALRAMRPDDPRVVPAIANCLGDADPATRELAGTALATIGDTGLAAAAQKLEDGDERERKGAAAALAASGSRGVPELAAALGSNSAETRTAAAEALRGMGPAGRDALTAATKTGSKEQRLAALSALSGAEGDDALVTALGDPLLEDMAREALVARGEEARPALERGARELGTGPQSRELLARLDADRARAIAGRLATGGDAAVEEAIALGPVAVSALAPLLGDRNDTVRANAVKALIGIGYASESPANERLVSVDPKERRAAAEVLGGIRSDTALRFLGNALGSDLAGTRESIVEYVASVERLAREVFLRALMEGNAVARKAAADGMVRSGAPGVSALRQAALVAPKEVRIVAVDALAGAGPFALQSLLDVLANDDADVARHVGASLEKRGADVVPLLLLKCTDPAWAGRRTGIEVLEAIGAKGLDALIAAAFVGSAAERSLARDLLRPLGETAVRKVVPQLRDKSARVRLAAAETLVSFVPDSKEATRVLVGLMDDADAQIRFVALTAMASMESLTKEQKKGLAGALRDENVRVRLAAAGALLKSNPKDRRARTVLDEAWASDDGELRAVAFGVSFAVAGGETRADVLERALAASQPLVVRSAALARLERLPVAAPLAGAIRLANEDADEGLRARGKKLYATLTSDPWLELDPDRTRFEAWLAAKKTRRGGMRERTDAVSLALEWFENHQSADGRWSCGGFQRECKLNKCGGGVNTPFDPGVTGMVLSCFLANGNTATHGPYSETVKRGLLYLIRIQDSEGCLGPRTSASYQYNHAFGALALVEAYAQSGAEALRGPAQRAVDFVHASQNPYLAWRYGIRDGDNDTSVTGCMVAVLRAARDAGLNVVADWHRGAVGWVEKMTEPTGGRVGYQRRGGTGQRYKGDHDAWPVEAGEPLTAIGISVRFASGQARDEEMLVKGAGLIMRKLPRWSKRMGTIDFYYWYWGSVAMWEMGGTHWKRWRDALTEQLIPNQITETGLDQRGSFDPAGPWGAGGGRVYSTAMACLALQVEWRHSERKGKR